MKFHDYHLSGYSVDCNTSTITLNLVWPYDDRTPDEKIIFTGVAGYQFYDALGSIICNIYETDLKEFISSKYEGFSLLYKEIGVPKYWGSSLEETLENLRGKRVWFISSSIGFEGHVISEKINQPEQVK